jgi:hypothetical protein
MRMGGGSGMGGGRHNRGGEGSERHSDAVAQRIDDNDAQAFLEAESVLTEAQRPRAREIAEQYREQLFDWRKAQSKQGSP